MKQELFFSTPVYVKDVGSIEFNKYLEENILNWSKQDKGIQKTNRNSWHSVDDMHKRQEYKPLVDLLFQGQYDIFNQEHLDSEPFLGNMWANINPQGGYNRPHIHSNSLWSGVYYVKTPENCGDLKLEDPRAVNLMNMPNRKTGELPVHLWHEVVYKPVAGRLIMFPSWLNHYVEPNQSNDIRISVSFNFLQKSLLFV